MNIILANEAKIEVSSIIPNGGGLTIDAVAGQLSEIEPHITNESMHTITCIEGDTVFARYDNQQLESLVKNSTGIHIYTRYKTLAAGIDVSKQLSELQNTILSVQNTQDVQNAAIAEIGELVSQSMTTNTHEDGEEATEDDTILCDDDKEKQSNN